MSLRVQEYACRVNNVLFGLKKNPTSFQQVRKSTICDHFAQFCQVILQTLKDDTHIACRAHAVPLSCRAAKGLECVFTI